MKLARSILGALALVSAPCYASTPTALAPFLDYSPIRVWTGQTAGTGGMTHALLVMELPGADGANAGMPAIIRSEARGGQSSVVAFSGLDGKPLPGWLPGEVRPATGGTAYISGTSVPYPRVIAAFASAPRTALIVSGWGGEEGRFSVGNYHSSALAISTGPNWLRRPHVSANFGAEDYRVHKVGLESQAPRPGWPSAYAAAGAQRITTPALLDLNGDGEPEVFAATGGSSSGFSVLALDGATGARLWETTLQGGYATNYVAIGKVSTLGRAQVVVMARGSTHDRQQLHLLDAQTGKSLASRELAGTVFYGSAPVLADMDGDNLDEVMVATQSALYVVGGDALSDRPGFPHALGDVWLGDAAPVVGDLGFSKGPEIALVTQVPGSASGARVHLIGALGQALFPPQDMPLGRGISPALADVDLDGRNELVIAARPAENSTQFRDAIWVFDFDRDNPGATHDAALWGQYGRTPERCNCSLIAEAWVQEHK